MAGLRATRTERRREKMERAVKYQHDAMTRFMNVKVARDAYLKKCGEQGTTPNIRFQFPFMPESVKHFVSKKLRSAGMKHCDGRHPTDAECVGWYTKKGSEGK